jgi:type IV secretory pathway TrbD component
LLAALVLAALVLLIGLLVTLLLLVGTLPTALLLLARTWIARLLAGILVGVVRIGHCRLLEGFGYAPARSVNARRTEEFAACAEEICGNFRSFWPEKHRLRRVEYAHDQGFFSDIPSPSYSRK